MNDQQLQAIEARWAKATPGPWECIKYNKDSPKMYGKDFSYKPAYLQPLNIRLSEDETGWDNAAAIASAPTDIADLLAEVRRLRCCGNCKAYKFKVRYEDTLREAKPEMICLGVDGSGKCDKWAAAG